MASENKTPLPICSCFSLPTSAFFWWFLCVCVCGWFGRDCRQPGTLCWKHLSLPPSLPPKLLHPPRGIDTPLSLRVISGIRYQCPPNLGA